MKVYFIFWRSLLISLTENAIYRLILELTAISCTNRLLQLVEIRETF